MMEIIMLRKHCLLCGLVGFINDEGTFQSHKQRLNEMQIVLEMTHKDHLASIYPQSRPKCKW